jgi:hypothetical protein
MTKKTDQKQTLKEKLNCPLYPKKLGKKLFLYSLVTFFIAFCLLVVIDNIFVTHILKNIWGASTIFGLIGAFLWGGFTCGGNNDDLKNSDISISGSHRMNNIHNMNNPANPLSYHHRNS